MKTKTKQISEFLQKKRKRTKETRPFRCVDTHHNCGGKVASLRRRRRERESDGDTVGSEKQAGVTKGLGEGSSLDGKL